MSKAELLHKAMASLNVDGFNVKRIKVFENPLTAHIEVENTVLCESVLAKFVATANKAFEHVEQRFLVTLTLTDFTRPGYGVEIIYSIKRFQKNRQEYSDETSIAIAHKMQLGLVSGIKATGASLFTTLPAA